MKKLFLLAILLMAPFTANAAFTYPDSFHLTYPTDNALLDMNEPIEFTWTEAEPTDYILADYTLVVTCPNGVSRHFQNIEETSKEYISDYWLSIHTTCDFEKNIGETFTLGVKVRAFFTETGEPWPASEIKAQQETPEYTISYVYDAEIGEATIDNLRLEDTNAYSNQNTIFQWDTTGHPQLEQSRYEVIVRLPNEDEIFNFYAENDTNATISFDEWDVANQVLGLDLEEGDKVELEWQVCGIYHRTEGGLTNLDESCSDYEDLTLHYSEQNIAPEPDYEEELATETPEPESTNSTNPFSDVDPDSLEGRATAFLYEKGIIGGYPDGEFKGDKSVNRAEAVKFVLISKFGQEEASKIMEVPADTNPNYSFPDIPAGEWFSTYVTNAAKLQVINGYPDGYFRPAQTVTTVELMKMIANDFLVSPYLPNSDSEAIPNSYKDVKDSDWFSLYLGVAEKGELFPDRIENILPGQELTRYDVAIALYQLLKEDSPFEAWLEENS